jgi:methyl-accepting chemotaxis protein
MNEAPLPKRNEVKMKSNKNNFFKVEIFIDSNSFINIIIKTIDKIPSMKYYGKYSFDDITKKNKYFLICGTISDVFQLLSLNLKNNNNLLKEETNELIIFINIPNPLSPQIDFKVQVEKKDYNSSINELSEIINKQNNKINELTEIINKQNDKINQQNNKINLLGPTINNILEKINQLILKNTYLWELKLYIKLF